MTHTVKYGAAYLHSNLWSETRARYERDPRAPHACAVCAAPRYQLHHRSYERLGAEDVADLLALCGTHHEALHRAWRQHRELRPADTLASFTDGWVRVRRREFPTAPLPDLALYDL